MSEVVLPGESLNARKPWVRKVGDQVIRYVRNGIEDAVFLALREQDNNSPVLVHLLEFQRRRLAAELDILRSHDIDVPEAKIEIRRIPAFVSPSQPPESMQLGLQITTPYIPGTQLDEVGPAPKNPNNYLAALNTTFDGLRSYVNQRHAEGERYLGDIFFAEQYIYSGDPNFTLVDLDPIFGVASDTNYEKAIDSITTTEYYLASQVL